MQLQKTFFKLIFLAFTIDDSVSLEGGEITQRLLHDVFDKDENFLANLKQAYKLTNKVLRTGDKQIVSLALTIFHATTSTAIENYFEDRSDTHNFLKLNRHTIQITIMGILQLQMMQNLFFLLKLADWFEERQAMQECKSQKLIRNQLSPSQ